MRLAHISFAAAIAVLLSVPGTADASLFEKETQIRFNFELGGDWWFPKDDAITTIYGSSSKFGPRLGLGVVWFKEKIPVVHIESNLQLGWTGKRGFEVGETSGSSSGETTRIGLFPVGLEALVGIDALSEQVVVPFGAIGFDVIPWVVEDAAGTVTKGTKTGIHGRFGIAFLLDVIEPERAGWADGRSGINDAYLVIAGQSTKAPLTSQDSGLNLSGWSLRVTLKFVI